MNKEKQLNKKATGVIAVAVMCSRVLGLIREVLFNSLFGSSLMGIFLIAFRAPNLLRDLFAEGALSISFVTVFSQKLETEGQVSAWALASKMLTLSIVLMSIITLLGIFFADSLIHILVPYLLPSDMKTVIMLTQIMYPFILLISLAAIVMGILNAKNVFGIPALASSFFNIGSIFGGVTLGWYLDPDFGNRALIGLAAGTLLGGLLQLLIQLPSLKRLNFRFKFDIHWKDDSLRKVLVLTVPAIIAASAVQINVLINSVFASYIGKEAITWLNSAFRLMQFPLGIFGVAVASITLPVISKIAVSGDDALFGRTLNQSIRLAIFLTLPMAFILWLFANPIISLIYEHGKFYQSDALQTAVALQYYSLGLVAYSCIKVLSPAFYSINKKWFPMFVSFISIFLNLLLNYLLIFKFQMGHYGLAISTAVSANFNVFVLYCLMSHWYNLNQRQIVMDLLRCGVVCVFLGSTCTFFIGHNTFLFNPLSPFLIRCIILFVALACFMSAYLFLTSYFKIEFARDLLNFVFVKLRRSKVVVS